MHFEDIRYIEFKTGGIKVKKIALLLSMSILIGALAGCNKSSGIKDLGIDVEGAIVLYGEGETWVVDDPVYRESEGKYVSPVGFEIDSLIEGIRESVSGVEFEDSYAELIENVGMTGFFNFDKTHSLVGYSTSDREQKLIITVKQYANFDKASYISVTYKTEDEKIEKSARNLLYNLYGEELIAPLFEGDSVIKKYRSKSGEYEFTTMKVADEEPYDEYVSIVLDYSPYEIKENTIDQFKVFESTEPLYREMSIFEGVSLKDIGSVLGEVWGDYAHAVLVRNTNSKATKTNGNTRSMELTNAVVFNDGMQSAVEIRAIVQEGDNLHSEIEINGSTPYCEHPEEALKKATSMLSFLGGEELEIEFEDRLGDMEVSGWVIQQFGKTLNQNVVVTLHADELGYYAVFNTFTVIQ